MNRKFKEKYIVLATHNTGKIEEFKHLFGEVNFNITNIGQYHWQPPEETGESFWENSLIKAREATRLTGMVSLADDSGLCVDLLKGAPGVYSADWAIKSDGSRDFKFAINKLVKEILLPFKTHSKRKLVATTCCTWNFLKAFFPRFVVS